MGGKQLPLPTAALQIAHHAAGRFKNGLDIIFTSGCWLFVHRRTTFSGPSRKLTGTFSGPSRESLCKTQSQEGPSPTCVVKHEMKKDLLGTFSGPALNNTTNTSADATNEAKPPAQQIISAAKTGQKHSATQPKDQRSKSPTEHRQITIATNHQQRKARITSPAQEPQRNITSTKSPAQQEHQTKSPAQHRTPAQTNTRQQKSQAQQTPKHKPQRDKTPTTKKTPDPFQHAKSPAQLRINQRTQTPTAKTPPPKKTHTSSKSQVNKFGAQLAMLQRHPRMFMPHR